MEEKESIEISVFMDESHDYCTSCNYKFQDIDDELCTIGYDENHKLQNCCKSCKQQVKDVVYEKSFYERHYVAPSHNATLWRYMDFSKYVSLLSTSSLYFARSDAFEDLLEGAQGIKANKPAWDVFYKNYFVNAILNPPDGGKVDLAEDELNRQVDKLLKQLEHIGLFSRERQYVSCWHENENESEAMWRLYSNYMENAIAIKTTYIDLSSSFEIEDRKNIQIGRVRYIDFKRSFSGINKAIWTKNVSFEHEREVRAVYFDFENNDQGKIFKCDLNVLIKSVHVSPKSPRWLRDLINDVNKKFNLHVEASGSELNHQPFY